MWVSGNPGTRALVVPDAVMAKYALGIASRMDVEIRVVTWQALNEGALRGTANRDIYIDEFKACFPYNIEGISGF